MDRGELSRIPASLEILERDGRYVFVPAAALTPEVTVHASVAEEEGMSALVAEDEALRLGLSFDFVATWISLGASELGLVGLTAAVSGALAAAGIACNVIAGLHHDHLLVDSERAPEALAVLESLVASAREALGGAPGGAPPERAASSEEQPSSRGS